MARKKGATAAQTYERVSAVYNFLVAGASTRKIIKAGEDLGWDVEERQVHAYISAANKELEQRADIHRDRELGKALLRLEAMYMKAMQRQVWIPKQGTVAAHYATKPDIRTALQVLQELHRVLGFHNPDISIKLTLERQVISEIQSGEIDWPILEEIFGVREAVTYYEKAGLQLPQGVGDILDMG